MNIFAKIKPTIPTPIYQQIRNSVIDAINRGELKPDEMIPSSSDLGKELNVSRMTVVQAYKCLAQDGIIYTIPGKGTFAAKVGKVEQSLQKLYGFTDEFSDKGLNPNSIINKQQLTKATDEIEKALEIKSRQDVYQIERIRLFNKTRVAIEDAYLPSSDFPNLLRFNFEEESLYETLRNHYGTNPSYASQIIECIISDSRIENLLGIPKSSCAYSMSRTTYREDDKPIEFVKSVYRTDKVRLRVVLRAGSLIERKINI